MTIVSLSLSHRITPAGVLEKLVVTAPEGSVCLEALRQLFDLSARADDAHAT